MRRFAVAAAATASVTALALGSCGGGSSAPSSSPTPTTAKQRAEVANLPAEQLPPKWRPARVEEHVEDPGLPEYCGVTALPKPLSAGRVDLYARTSSGPFILQYTAVAGDEDAAEAVMGKLARVAKTCRSDKNGKARYEVRPVTDIDDIGEQAVGFHYEAQTGVTSGVVVFRRDDMLVTVVDLGPPAVPYDTVRRVAGAVDDRIA